MISMDSFAVCLLSSNILSTHVFRRHDLLDTLKVAAAEAATAADAVKVAPPKMTAEKAQQAGL